MRSIIFVLLGLFSSIAVAQNPGHINAEAIFLNENSYYHQGFTVFGSINSTKPTSTTTSSSLQKLGSSEIFGGRIFGLSSFDYDSDGRDDVVAYGINGSGTRSNKIWVFDIIGDHSLNNNFTKQIALDSIRFSGLKDEEYDINGITTGDFDGDGFKDDIAVIARRSSYTQHFRYRTLITLFYDELSEDFELGYEYEDEYEESGYSFLSITAGNFRNYSGEPNPIDDIAVVRSVGDSNPDLIGKVLIFPNRNVGGTKSIGYPTHLAPLNYDVRAIDTNENYNATTNAHSYFRPNTIAAGNFDTDDTLDELALIARSASSSNPDDYYRILILDDFGFPTNPDASYSIKTTLLPSSYRKAIHAIAVEDFDDDEDDDFLVYGSNGHGNNDRLDTDNDARMFLFSGDGTGFFSYKKTVSFNSRQVLAVTAGRFSRPEYANIKDGTNDYFPLMWYTAVYGDSNSTKISESHTNLNEILNDGIMNGLVLAAHSNWVRPDDQNIEDYLDIVDEDLKVSLALGIKFGDRYGSDCPVSYCTGDNIDDYQDYFSERINEYNSNPNIWSWYLEDEPSNPIRDNNGNIIEPASFEEIPTAYNYATGVSHTKPYMFVDNLMGWTDNGLNLYAGKTDIAMWDDYPYTTTNLSNRFSFVAQTAQFVSDLMVTYKKRNNLPTLTPTLGVLQAEDGQTNDNPPVAYYSPTEADYRYMTYTALIHGARGLAYWAYREADQSRIDNINTVVTQLDNLNIPEIISSKPYKGVSTQFENTYSTGQGYQKTVPYSTMDKDPEDLSTQYFHQINWINYAFRKPSELDGYYLLMVNDLNLIFSSNSGGKDKVTVTLPISITRLQRFNFDDNTWYNYTYSGKTFSANFQPWEVKLFRINGMGSAPYPAVSKRLSPSLDPETTKNFSFELHQNYPNPFNPSTSISYSIQDQGHVNLSVYNSIGQLVATLVDGVKTPGKHQVVFDANRLSSGVYFYKLKSESNVLFKKMLLIK